MNASRKNTPVPDAPAPVLEAHPDRRITRVLFALAWAILLASLASRCFLAEMPFRLSSKRLIAAAVAEQAPGSLHANLVDRADLSRIGFSVAIFAAAMLWALGQTGPPSRSRRAALMLTAWVGFTVVSLGGIAHYGDVRSAMLVAAEQSSLILAGWLTMQLCADRRRFRMLVIVLAALAATMAAKGLWQTLVEVPERVADFEMYRAERLAEVGWRKGTAQATLIEARMRDPSPFGYFALANVFASLLLVLVPAAAAVAWGKIRHALRRRREQRVEKGEVDLRILAAGLTTVAALVALVVLVLTRSRGALGAAFAAGIALAVVLLGGERIRRRWKLALVVGVLLVACGLGATVAYGLANDGLPSKSLTFRWYYWTAGAEIFADHPIRGIGGGNFPEYYLHYRRAAAEEEVKTPHNFLVHTAVQFGLLGGIPFLLVLGWMLVLAIRPRREPGPPPQEPRMTRSGLLWLTLALPAAVMLVRIGFTGFTDPAMIFLEAVLPAAALSVFLLLGTWWGDRLLGDVGPAKMLLAAGGVAFLLHNLLSFSLWTPATGLAFWMALGAAAAPSFAAAAGEPRSPQPPDGRARLLHGALLALAFAVVVALLVVTSLWPIAHRTAHTEAALAALQRGNATRARELAVRAAEADQADALAAADAARIFASTAARDDKHTLRQAHRWALEAARRHPAASAPRRQAGRIAMQLAHVTGDRKWAEQAVDDYADAVERNPVETRLRIDLAKALLAAGRGVEARVQLDAAERLNEALNPESLERLTRAERSEIRQLRRQIAAATNLQGDA